MSEVATRRMTIDAFLSWEESQDLRCELVDGQPMAMTGATFAHDLVVGNLAFAVRSAFRDRRSRCKVFSSDIGLVTGPATLRRPDLAVYCPPFDTAASRSSTPKLLAEVLSRSTEHVDQFMKLEEYRALPSLDVFIVIEPERVDIGLWQRRDDRQWQHLRYTDDIDARIDLPGLDITVSLRDIYDDVVLLPRTGPRLVWPDEPLER